jgi:hypothetical protein
MKLNFALILASSLLLAACGSTDSGSPDDPSGGGASKPEPRPEPVTLSENFPEGGEADRDRFAIFVGIDSYPKIPGGDLDGCTNDVLKLKELFAKHFKFKRSAIRTNAAATREGVKELFEGLIKQVTQAKEAGVKDISVLLCYAGHGSQVKDQKEGGDENDGLDETWVTYDSSFEKGENDIRDDEILDLIQKLEGLGSQVLLISDSCHSGSVHRGATFAKARAVKRPNPPEGPTTSLLGGSPRSRGGAAPGFVSFTACRDSEQAYECKDADKNPCGRMSFVLRKLLPRVDKNTSYQGLYDQLVGEFAKLGFSKKQTPQFHASPEKRFDYFLEGKAGDVPACAKVTAQRGAKVTLDMGSAQGIQSGATVAFFKTFDDLKANKGSLGTGTVTQADAFSSKVELDDDFKAAGTSVRVTSVSVQDFVVFAHPSLPAKVSSALSKAAKEGRFGLGESPYDVAVYGLSGGRVGLFGPEALPDAQGKGGTPIAVVAEDKVLARLVYQARVRRLLSLSFNQEELQCVVRASGKKAPGAKPSAIAHLTTLDDLQFEITNRSSIDLYVTLLQIDSDGDVHPHPLVHSSKEMKAIRPGATEPFELYSPGSPRRMKFKVIATERVIDFRPLVKAPPSGLPKKHRGGESALGAMLGDALLGTQATSRGDPLPAKAAPMKWATASLVVEIYDAKQLQGMLSEESPVTRHTAVALLGRMGKRAKAALPTLRRLAEKDPDAGVRKAAAGAQKRVGG